MKTKLLLILLAVCGLSSAQTINFPDANLKNRLLSLSIDTSANGEIEVAEALSVTTLDLNDANIADLSGMQHFTNVTFLSCAYNQITNLAPLSTLVNLEHLDCTNNLVTTIDPLLSLPLIYLDCGNNQLTSLNITELADTLTSLGCYNNQITNLNLGPSSLGNLSIHNNLITSLTYHCTNLTGSGAMAYLGFANNPLTVLNLTGHALVVEGGYQGTELDFSEFVYDMMEFAAPNLTQWNLKNGYDNPDVQFSGSSLAYVCADEGEIEGLSYQFPSGVNINTYCSFTPGEEYYTVTGQNKFDIDGNGCDSSDVIVPNLKFTLTSGSDSGVFISDHTGDYSIPVLAGMHNMTPVLENTDYFVISPTSVDLDFPTMSSPFAQNFCLSANGSHPDLEIISYALNAARPGFDTTYKMILKNNGTTMEFGSVLFNYDESILDYISADIVPAIITPGNLSFDFNNLMPFESREYNITINVNAPTETPPVNNGDEFTIISSISPIANDQNIDDNSNTLYETVVGSYDPNDITCLEGDTVSPAVIGEYVHYLVRFENTGTFSAENVVVKLTIDPNQFDVSSLMPISSSHPFYTRITEHKVEFIFENIVLPFDNANNDGHVAFKIKTMPTLEIGDTFSNAASIYFDYNHPIVTNTATTTISALATADFSNQKFAIYPNPAYNQINITSNKAFEIQSVTIYNLLGQIVLSIPDAQPGVIDVSMLKSGHYLIKLQSASGTATEKFIKL